MFVFIIQGYEQKNENGSLNDVTTYELYAKDEKEALKKAKKLIKKSFYRISGVIEKNDIT
jgi:hypothetical protein